MKFRIMDFHTTCGTAKRGNVLGLQLYRSRVEIKYLATLQRQKTENLKQKFLEKELRSVRPNFHIHVSVSDLYIPRIGLHILLQKICGMNVEGCGRAIPFLGTHIWDFRCSAGYQIPDPDHIFTV
jgi:hypothetical protein